MANARTYWEDRYREGGTSGHGSVGKNRKWKWSVIDHYLPHLPGVVDVGCGDLSFWEGRSTERYIGIDISETVIGQNRKARPKWRFIVSPAEKPHPVREDVVLCLDLLFHVLAERDYRDILANLARFSNRWIFIYTWHRNIFRHRKNRTRIWRRALREGKPLRALRAFFFPTETDGVYQRYRRLEEYLDILEEQGFRLLEKRPSEVDPFGAMYVLRRDSS